MYDQALRLNYTSPYATTSEVTVELARELAEVTPADLGASFFCSSGSEAIEAAIKLARHYHVATGQRQRYKVVSLRRAYHGSTVRGAVSDRVEPGFAELRRAADPMVPAGGSRTRCRPTATAASSG
jgi:adenosylmethionine-8-amino-7-oxononanoate aminotransferase